MEIVDDQPQRRLRVVLVLRGEPLEERSFPLEEVGLFSRRPTRVTLGRGGNDTFAIPPCRLPPSFPLLRAVGPAFVLRLSEGMVGRLHLSGEDMSVQQLFAAHLGIAVGTGAGGAQVREQLLGPDDWGIVATEASGEVALFFQFLPLPDLPRWLGPEPPGAPAQDLSPRQPVRWLSWLPVPVDRFMLHGLGISAVICLAVVLVALLSWEPRDPLSLDPPPSPRLARLLMEKRKEARALRARPPVVNAGGGWSGIAGLLVREHDRRNATSRPLLSDDVDVGPPAPASPGGGEESQQPESQQAAPPQPPAAQQPESQQAAPPQPPAAQQPDAERTAQEVPLAKGPEAPAQLPAAQQPAVQKPEPEKLTPQKPTPPAGPSVPVSKPVSAQPSAPQASAARPAPVAAPPPAQPPAARPAPTATPPAQPPAARPAPAAAPPASAARPTPPAPTATPKPAPAPRRPLPREPVVMSGAPATPGPLSKGQIDRVISARQVDIEACYRRAIQRVPRLGGRLMLIFSVDAAGKMTQVRIENSTLKDPQMEECILPKIRGWRFPASRGPTRNASIPFVFRSP